MKKDYSKSIENNPFSNIDFSEVSLSKDKEEISPINKKETKKFCTIKIEKKNRGGKTVTILYDFIPENILTESFAKTIKQQLGTGATIKNNCLEIQGDLRKKIIKLLQNQGFKLKGMLDV